MRVGSAVHLRSPPGRCAPNRHTRHTHSSRLKVRVCPLGSYTTCRPSDHQDLKATESKLCWCCTIAVRARLRQRFVCHFRRRRSPGGLMSTTGHQTGQRRRNRWARAWRCGATIGPQAAYPVHVVDGVDRESRQLQVVTFITSEGLVTLSDSRGLSSNLLVSGLLLDTMPEMQPCITQLDDSLDLTQLLGCKPASFNLAESFSLVHCLRCNPASVKVAGSRRLLLLHAGRSAAIFRPPAEDAAAIAADAGGAGHLHRPNFPGGGLKWPRPVAPRACARLLQKPGHAVRGGSAQLAVGARSGYLRTCLLTQTARHCRTKKSESTAHAALAGGQNFAC